MGKRIENKMKRRFGDPMRVTLSFPEKPMSSAERAIHNKDLVSAYVRLLESLLGRKSTQAEIDGRVSPAKLEKAIKNRKSLNPVVIFPRKSLKWTMDWLISFQRSLENL